MPTKSKPKFVIELARSNPRDVGPCDSEECDNRAHHCLRITVNRVAALAWVCDEHRDEVLA